MMCPRQAIISVSDKIGVVDLARFLTGMGCRIISTGGTATLLRENGIETTRVSDITGFPEILGGRVKTLHPAVYGGLLADRQDPAHMATLTDLGITPMDMVVVNLYPFVEAVASGGDAVENIDIGGVSLIRAAAKNHRDVAVLTSPDQYPPVIRELKETGGLSRETLGRLAVEGFAHTSAYDASIRAHFAEAVGTHTRPGSEATGPGQDHDQQDYDRDFPPVLTLAYRRLRRLRYGENPHQRAALYVEAGYAGRDVITADQLGGQTLSYNNMLDFSGALNIVREFQDPTAVLIKHNNPCGVASADTIAHAYRNGLECDPMSAFGGIIALNREVDPETAGLIRSSFKEGVIAPAFHPDALSLLTRKKRMILLRVDMTAAGGRPRFTQIGGGLLMQDPNLHTLSRESLRVVSDRAPHEDEVDSMLFAWRVVKHIRSNAMLLVRGHSTVGIGAGQMSRVDSTIIACRKAGERARGAVLASDAFIPFPDSVDVAARAGVIAIIQTGGSIRDGEVLERANRHGISMVHTGARNFKH